MLKKNTRKRLLAGALATVMMLTMCPSWALADNLADDEGIVTLPANEEIAVPVDDSTPAADTTKTPADPTPSVPEAKPAEDQNTAPAPSDGGANSGTDSAESGNSTNPTIPEVSENNSQNNDTVSNSPENEISMASPDAVPYGWNDVKTIEAEYWITNLHAEDDNGSWKLSIDKDTVGEDGKSVAELAPPERRATADETYNTVFWQARVHHGLLHHQTTGSNDDKTQLGTEITSIRYKDGEFECYAKDSSKDSFEWTKFNIWTDQLVFYYLIRTEYSDMVQIDVSDWTVDKEDTHYSDRRSVTYKVIVDNPDGADNGTVLASRKFWYNKAFKVSSVRVREIGNHPNYTINRVALEPDNLGKVNETNNEFQFSLDLTQIEPKQNATVNIYVSAKKYNLSYDAGEGTIKSGDKPYTVGEVYPDTKIIVPNAEREGYTFDGWYDETTGKPYVTGDLMPGNDLKLTAKWTASTPTPPETPAADAMYFVLLPNLGVPKNGESQGKTNYLPNDTSDGGVIGAIRATGYPDGHLTKAGKEAADKGEFNANGVNPNYLLPPSDLGFFTAANWNGTTYPNYPTDKTNTSAADITALLGTNYNPEIAEVVWYTVKYDPTDGYHVDGYVKNVDVTVTYHSNYGDDVTDVYTATTGNEYAALGYAATKLTARENYTFDGWYTDAACKTPYTTSVLMTGLHLYAKWVPNDFKVSYFYQNEQGTETQFGDIDTYAFGTDVTVRTAHPEKEGYTFTGWTNIANIVTVDADGKFTMPAQDVRFDAQFSINQYHVTYKVDGKDYGNTETYVFNSDVAIRPVPTKEGYTFTGWKIGTADAENFKMPAHDVTIEGTFAINRYTVTYKVDTEVVGTDVYDFNSDVVIRDVPTKEGYTFSGWKIGTADAENFKMPAHDVTIEGTFAKNSSGHHHRRPTVTIPDKVPTGLNGNDHYAYIVGYPDKTVRPQNGITRAEVATIFFRLLTDETRNANSTKSNSYSDVAAGAWYNHAVSTLSAMGIVKGDSNGKFNPNAPITRAEFAAIAARFDDKANSTTADFSDIVSHWAKNEISAASNNGWINGYPDGTFRPDNKITRAEAMTLVNRVLKRLPETAEDLHDDMIKWSDNSDASQWFYLAVQEATNSHYYKAKENKSEKWTELRDTRDWTELEK
ncbi:S-layer homology domain-containing protein [Agathobaculum sp.]|uniref:S-layer homology domain-containing protein n=1 Tax=Agathobaculum sp. TaxID=2048138 RepID=UPI003AB86BB7